MKTSKVTKFEFIALMAFLMSVVALAIDALLPALDIIGNSLDTQENSDHQLLITMIFIGLGVGPLFFGPLSDSLGRKPMVFVGFSIFILASFICVYSNSLEIMVLGRILQGFGLSAPRTISVAIIRDLYSGDYMAKIMSFVIVIFLLVPIIAPAIGKFILNYFNWEAIFIFQIIFCLLIAFWFWNRQEETLNHKNRIAFKINLFSQGFLEDRTQKCQVYVAPETCARPKRARETTRKLKTTSLRSLVVKQSGKREKRDPDIYTSEPYFKKESAQLAPRWWWRSGSVTAKQASGGPNKSLEVRGSPELQNGRLRALKRSLGRLPT